MLVWLALPMDAAAATRNPRAVCDLLDRIGGKGTSRRISTVLDENLVRDGQECFVISARKGKPWVAANTMSALTTGVNWYLNHYAHVNISWNQLRMDLRGVEMPIPSGEEWHTTDARYRYYLNYCTFGYSMSTWTWERWQQEIDWMALHGINMPLQIVGLERVWRDFLMKDYGYSEEDAENFVPGPAYTAWWGMNNLEGWGGDGADMALGVHNDAWYDRQATLARRIGDRERELGMQPVLPGFSGMVPSNFQEKTGKQTERANLWCQFQRPAILDPTTEEFAVAARRYYNRLHQVMGASLYYSMDPFHEGGTISSGRYSQGYQAVYDAMNECCGPQSSWVIQQWQWAPYQATSLKAVPDGRLVVLDLFADGRPEFDTYQGYVPQHAVYCTIPNFGGRTGFMGRLPRMAHNYFVYHDKYPTVRGVGAAPEAIESVPVVYDLLYELPWMQGEPDVQAWIRQYALARYGQHCQDAVDAWLTILRTAMNETTALQGPHEAVMCGRPGLDIDRVSSWGGSRVYYDAGELVVAARQLLRAAEQIKNPIGTANMSYDLCDIVRQVMSDRSKTLLGEVKAAHEQGNESLFAKKRDEFLQLILDTDRLLGTNPMFRLGRWTQMAQQVAHEVKGCTPETEQWMVQRNALTLITTWGAEAHSEYGGLRDYSYRQWQGMLSSFYYPRWQYWFAHGMQAPPQGWFSTEWTWAHGGAPQFSAVPEGSTIDEARRILQQLKQNTNL